MTPEVIVGVLTKIVDMVMEILGPEKTKALVTKDEVSRANAVADAIEWVRFGPLSLLPAIASPPHP